jgi:2-phosphoglycerate kinase
LNFKDGYSIADQVEQSLRAEGFEVVPERDYVLTVALLLEARHGAEARHRYEETTRKFGELRIADPEGPALPYSRGILARSLMTTGLGSDVSHNLARRLEAKLWKGDERSIDRSHLRLEVEQLVLEEAGLEFSRWYSLINHLQQQVRPIVLLIGGAPGVGKSTFAAELGYRLGIPRIVGSDPVRETLRSLIGKDLSPTLHRSSYDVWRAELLPSERTDLRPERKRVVRGS